ncbi:MAG: S8 family serine peptidase [Sandaracinus sp.]
MVCGLRARGERGLSRARVEARRSWWALACVGAVCVWLAPVARADEALEARVRDALRSSPAMARRWPSRPLLDAAREVVGAEIVWAREGTRGAGATVCVIDTGVDLSHRDFRDAEGRTRARWVLDLDASPRGVHEGLELGGGAVWSRDEIDDALARGEAIAADWHGPGTAVASAVLGDDAPSVLGDDGVRAGIAPEAELVVVRALRRGTLGFHAEDVVRGARFCLDPRVSDPARTAVLLALGGHDGPHDGSSDYERAIAALTTSGAAVVVAAGNDGDAGVHAAARLVRDEPVRLVVRLPSPTIDDALVVVAIRGVREVRAARPLGALGPWSRDGRATEEGDVTLDATDPSVHYVIARGALAAGDLVIEARGARARGAGLDAWLVDARLGDPLFSPRFVGDAVIEAEEVTMPATADGVIAVGASVSRDFLAAELGPGLTLEADVVGRAPFSSRGPRVDGAPLPTLLAPGGWIVAARSSALDPSDEEALFAGSVDRFERMRRGEDRLAIAGTSLSAAIVAGAVALARATAISSRDERSLLAASARALEGAAQPHDLRVGSGVLDLPAYTALRAAPPGSVDAVEFGCTRADVTPAASDLWLTARARGGGAERVQVRARGSSTTSVLVMRDGWGQTPVALPRAAAGEVLEVEAGSGDRLEIVCAVPVVLGPGSRAPLSPAGGCRIGRSPPQAAGVLAALLVLVAVRARRPRGTRGMVRP